jgi:hypothetical protein
MYVDTITNGSPGGVVLVLSPPAIEEIGVEGREIESRRGKKGK